MAGNVQYNYSLATARNSEYQRYIDLQMESAFYFESETKRWKGIVFDEIN